MLTIYRACILLFYSYSLIIIYEYCVLFCLSQILYILKLILSFTIDCHIDLELNKLVISLSLRSNMKIRIKFSNFVHKLDECFFKIELKFITSERVCKMASHKTVIKLKWFYKRGTIIKIPTKIKILNCWAVDTYN